MEYVEYGVEAGLDVDEFAPRLSFFFNSHNDFFEEIAKFRAARRIWAKVMRDRYGAKDPRSWMLRFHTQTAGCSLTAQQPYNNIVRVTIQALPAVLGGTNSLHTNSLDETLALPTESRVKHRAADAADHRPRVGRHQHHRSARRLLLHRGADRPDGAGLLRILREDRPVRRDGRGHRGRIPAARDLGRRLQYQRAVDSKEKLVVGVNDFTEEDGRAARYALRSTKPWRASRRVALAKLRRDAGQQAVSSSLQALRTGLRRRAQRDAPLIDAVKTYATVGEISDVMPGGLSRPTKSPRIY